MKTVVTNQPIPEGKKIFEITIGDVRIALYGKLEIAKHDEGRIILSVSTDNSLQFAHIRDDQKTPVKVTYWDHDKKEDILVLEHKVEELVPA